MDEKNLDISWLTLQVMIYLSFVFMLVSTKSVLFEMTFSCIKVFFTIYYYSLDY